MVLINQNPQLEKVLSLSAEQKEAMLAKAEENN